MIKNSRVARLFLINNILLLFMSPGVMVIMTISILLVTVFHLVIWAGVAVMIAVT